VALTRKTVNIADVYDQANWRATRRSCSFQRGVDQRTGYRTKQMLVAPLIAVQSRELLGVVQFINNRDRRAVPAGCRSGREGAVRNPVGGVLAAPETAANGPHQVRRPGAGGGAVGAELELATRAARKKDIDIEDVLIDEFRVKLLAIGAALEKFFGVPYEPFRRTASSRSSC
jgi:hypothetical protein